MGGVRAVEHAQARQCRPTMCVGTSTSVYGFIMHVRRREKPTRTRFDVSRFDLSHVLQPTRTAKQKGARPAPTFAFPISDLFVVW